jgi:hypothetical protein
MAFLSSAKRLLSSIISSISETTDCDDDDSPVEAYIYRLDTCYSAMDYIHHSFQTRNEIYLPQQSLALIYSDSEQKLYINKCEKPRNERYTDTWTMAKRKTELINYFITRRQVNTIVELYRKQEEVRKVFDCFIQQNQKGIIEDLEQPEIGRAPDE